MQNQVPAVSPEILGRLQSILREFTPSKDSRSFASRLGGAVRIELNDDLPVPALLYFLLVHVLEFPDLGQFEKTAWEIAFLFRGLPCTIALQKFGPRLYLGVSDVGGKSRLARDILRFLRSALRLLERHVFEPFAQDQVRSGNVVVVNQLPRLKFMYRFFRERAEAPFSRDVPPPAIEGQWLASLLNAGNEATFNALAAINAYFSTLEHALVLALPFIGFDPTTETIPGFIGMKWKDKFCRIYDIDHDRRAKQVHDELHRIAERYRNTFSHGALGKEGGTLYFPVPDVALMPARLSRVVDSPHYDFLPSASDNFVAVFKAFDRTDAWMRDGTTAGAMEFADSGLDVPFDDETATRLREAASTGSLPELIEDWSILEEQAANMDW